MEHWRDGLGIASGILLFLGNVPYLYSIYRGKTRPNRVSWWVWTAISLLLVSSSAAMGVGASLWLPVSQLASQLLIALHTFKYGEGGWQRLDRFCLAGAILSLLLWWRTQVPLVALLLNVGMDAIGALPTLRKVYFAPQSENRLFWLIFWAASGLNLLAVDQWTVAAIYPLYLFGLGAMVVGLQLRVELPIGRRYYRRYYRRY